MKKLLLGLTAGVMAFGLAACSGGTPGTDASSSGGKIGEGKTLTVWIMEGTNPDATAFFDQVKTSFKDSTGADVDIEMVPWASAKDKFATAIAGGTTPDVAEVGTTWTPEFADAGALVDLTDRVEADGLTDDLVDSLVDAGTVDGSLYGMPWYAGVRAFLYNKEIFEKAGVSEPTNWDELTEAVTKIKETQPDVTPFPIAGGSEYGVYPWIWGNDGEIATESDGQWTSQINSADAVEGIEYYTGLALDHNSSEAAAATWKETDLLKAFEQGNTGMVIQGSWTPARIAADAPDLAGKIGAFVIPAKDGGIAPSFVGGSHLSIFENSENQDLAWEFVKLMTTGDLAQEWAEQSNYFPGLKSMLNEQMESGDELTQVFARQMVEGGASVPVTPLWGKVQGKQVTTTMLQSILSGSADAQTAADTAAASMDETFAEA
ncbi:sugar ABC transporter substrate-binding protein [Brooklawnia cerclae]|uniref:N,N'-diacetylchitobiose transport system substrate-binding protein n=1 Tax=Brooklawnia cerclae TaxID=349934 RepID=A0ABX0SIY3_9ACTN|nr:sugar ABC transporter substrate-binding protein [Brooklawnia cerclae]NIH58348.1 N,N'-diacetylchitobiose transport system substrate-binding protein [Brooklawnia cerclae]